MDYYKMIYDNFISTFVSARKFITHDNILSPRAINNMKLFLKLPSFIFQKFLDPDLYTKYILYASAYILSNFFMINNKKTLIAPLNGGWLWKRQWTRSLIWLKQGALFTRARRFTADLPTPGITVISEWN